MSHEHHHHEFANLDRAFGIGIVLNTGCCCGICSRVLV